MAATSEARIPKPAFGNLIRSLIVGLLLAYLTQLTLIKHGVSIPIALAASSIFPVADTIYEYVRRRHFAAVDALSLIGIVVGVGLSLWRNDAHFALVKESFVSGVIGIAFLASVFRGRPAIFMFARETTDEPERFEALWNDYPEFQITMRRMTWMWGGGLVFEASLRVGVALVAPPMVTLTASPAIALVTFGCLMIATIAWTRVTTARAREAFARETAR